MDRAVFHGFIFPNMHIQFQSREVFELNRSINNKLKKRVGKNSRFHFDVFSSFKRKQKCDHPRTRVGYDLTLMENTCSRKTFNIFIQLESVPCTTMKYFTISLYNIRECIRS